jgi:hypothetical protein
LKFFKKNISSDQIIAQPLKTNERSKKFLESLGMIEVKQREESFHTKYILELSSITS